MRKECSLTAQICQTLPQRSLSSSITSAIFFLYSSSHVSIFCCIKYKVCIFTCNFLISLFLSYHIHIPTPSSSPKPLIPRFKEVPLWFVLHGTSCFRKILCEQPGLSNDLPLKIFSKLFFWNFSRSLAAFALPLVVCQMRHTSHYSFANTWYDNANNNTGKCAREIWPYAEPADRCARVFQRWLLYPHVFFPACRIMF